VPACGRLAAPSRSRSAGPCGRPETAVCGRPRAADAMLLSRLGFGGGSKAAPAYNRQSRPGEYLVELAAYVRRHENALLQAAIKFTLDAESCVPLRACRTQQLGGSHHGSTRYRRCHLYAGSSCCAAASRPRRSPRAGRSRYGARPRSPRSHAVPCIAVTPGRAGALAWVCRARRRRMPSMCCTRLRRAWTCCGLSRRGTGAMPSMRAVARTLANHSGRTAEAHCPGALGTWSAA